MNDLTGLNWRKSTRSGSNNDCVEAADLANGGTAIRDSKDPAGPVLCFSASEWRAFVAGVKEGEFDGRLGQGVAGR